MRLLIVCVILLTIVLVGCGVSELGAPQGMDSTAVMATQHAATSAAASPTFDQDALQEQMDRFSNEATIVAATMAALHFAPSADPAVATEAARRYQDNIATFTALQPTLVALSTPLAAPHISEAARAAANAAYGAGAANAVANAASMTPVAGQSAEEVALMQEATVVAATIVALNSGGPVEPAVATEATRRYQDNIASIVALQPPSPTVMVYPTSEPPYRPDLQSVPVAPAPGILAGITLPTTSEEVEALFRSMPPSIAGQDQDTTRSQLSPSRFEVAYGKIPISGTDESQPRILLHAVDFEAERTPGWTGAHEMVFIVGYLGNNQIAWGRDGDLYWSMWQSPVDPTSMTHYQSLFVSSGTGTWIFTLVAASPEEFDALAGSFAAALSAAR
jgi:hypothetical protein